MLTTNECINLEDYTFKYSPESCNSSSTDYTDLPSDEDFLQQLSSDLDIPLLLNPGEDELSLLNSFFDKSPAEIMSEIALPSPQSDNGEGSPKQHNELEDTWKFISDKFSNLPPSIKVEPSDNHSSPYSSKSNSPVQSLADGVNFFEIKDELKNEPPSPSSMPAVSIQTEVDSKNVLISSVSPSGSPNQLKIQRNNTTKIGSKRIAIQPKNPLNETKNKVVLFNNLGSAGVTNTNIINPPPAKVVVLENVSAVPITTTVAPISPSPPVIINTSPNLSLSRLCNIDAKALKRQQRKIKNRESACLSRKKKKDYLTSLENQVKELTTENQKLKLQNAQLAERLMKYEGNNVHKISNVKTNIVLCMFLFSVAFNLDYLRNSFISKNQENFIHNNPPEAMDHHRRNLLWTDEELLEKNSSNFSPFSMCPATINQTESARLVLELERWIGKPKDAEKPSPVNVTKLSSIQNNKLKSLRKRKQRKYATTVISPVYSVGDKLPHAELNKELQVFSPTPEQLYSEFFEAINRQYDTFYVVSFSDHHMLLPALHHNKTRRPKMSLIMPSMLQNENISQPTLVPLMQIDCEVLDTRLIQVRYGSIPQHLRKNGNSTTFQNADDVSKASNSGTNYTHKKAYKPYFIKQKSVSTGDDTDLYNMH